MQLKFIDSLPLKVKLALLPVIFLGSSAMVVTEISSGIQEHREYATIINMAGRQRMLNQRYTKEVLSYAATLATAGSSVEAKHPKTQLLFNNSLSSLTNGGELLVNPNNNTRVAIEGVSDATLLAVLKENKQLATELQQEANLYIDNVKNDLEVSSATILALTDQVHTTANKAVQLFVQQSNTIIDQLVWKCIVLSVIAGAISLLVCLAIGSSIARPVSHFRNTLKKAAQGNLYEEPALTRTDEFGDMSIDLNNTLQAVRLALGSDKVDWADIATLLSELKVDLQSTRAIVTQVPTSMLMLDINGQVSYINPQARREIDNLKATGNIKNEIEIGSCLEASEFNTVFSQDFSANSNQLILDIGDEHLDVSTHALIDENNKSTGTLLTWKIVTQDVKLQKESDKLRQEQLQKAESLTQLVSNLHHALDAAANGDLKQSIPEGQDKSFNDIARTVNSFISKINYDLQNISARAADLMNASDTLSSNAGSIDNNSRAMHERTFEVSKKAGNMNELMNSAATATTEFGASIKEIELSTNKAVSVTTEAVSITSEATQTVEALYTSSNDIENVLKFINSIAEQTNLLALNATIEAARAGDAGKGFAVVANEVKELAKQTSDATDEIAARITSIQTSSTSAVDSISKISAIVDDISDYQNTIASALTEQTAVSKDMAKTISNSSQLSENVSHNIEALVGTNQQSMDAVTESYEATQEVVKCAKSLEQLLSHYAFSKVKQTDT